MNRNVLILSSSPRKGGNSETLCEEFRKGAEAAQNSVELVHLAEREIHYCTGCYACARSGRCKQKDDMAELLDRMIAADVVVLSTPVYFYSMCAQMKTVLDRTVARYREISDKEFYFILAAADTNQAAMQRTVEGFRGFTDCLSGAQEKGILYGTGAWKAGEIQNTAAMQQAYAMGRAV